jgi:membrane protein DedA with SNARE-associated domain
MELPSRRVLRAVLIGAILVVLAVVLHVATGGDAFGVADGGSDVSTYLAIFLLIAGDAVVPVLPGETTLNAASTAAAGGSLELPLVILAGALGATIGDSVLFMLARRNRKRVQPQIDRAKRDARVMNALGYLGDNRKILLVFARYVPGLRFVVNATFGLSELPYLKFLPWSALGALLWSTYTCLLAYWVGSTIEDYPLASVVISGAITTALISVLFLRERRRRDRATTTDRETRSQAQE